MKQPFISQAGLVFAALMLSLAVGAQDAAPLRVLLSVTVTQTSNVSQEVNKSFQEASPDAASEAWRNLDKNYVVRLITEDLTNQAIHKNNGVLTYQFSFGQENNLPEDVRKRIANRYPNFNVSSVLRITQDQRQFWIANLEDSKNMLLIRAENGETEQVESHNKG